MKRSKSSAIFPIGASSVASRRHRPGSVGAVHRSLRPDQDHSGVLPASQPPAGMVLASPGLKGVRLVRQLWPLWITRARRSALIKVMQMAESRDEEGIRGSLDGRVGSAGAIHRVRAHWPVRELAVQSGCSWLDVAARPRAAC